MSVMERISVEVNTAEITPPFPVSETCVKEHPISSVRVLESVMRGVLIVMAELSVMADCG